jgi:hypothetical protein
MALQGREGWTDTTVILGWISSYHKSIGSRAASRLRIGSCHRPKHSISAVPAYPSWQPKKEEFPTTIDTMLNSIPLNFPVQLNLTSGYERNRPNRQLLKPTGSITPHILLWMVQIVALASPRFRCRRLVFAGAIIATAIASQINPHFTNDIALAQPFTIGWSNYLSTLEKILFSGPGEWEGSLWHVDKPPQEATAYSAFGYPKVRWAIALLINLRGILWNFQVKNVPAARRKTRSAFLTGQLVNVLYYVVMADLMVQLGIRFFYTTPDGTIGALNTKYLTLRHRSWRWSFAKAFVFGAAPYYMVCLQYNMFSLPAVLLGISKPEVRAGWPNLAPDDFLAADISGRTGLQFLDRSQPLRLCEDSGASIGTKQSVRFVPVNVLCPPGPELRSNDGSVLDSLS